MNFNKILVPVDFSEFSDMAVDYALFLAENYNARITLMHSLVLHHEDVEGETHLKDYAKFAQDKEKEIRAELQQRHNREAGKRGLSIEAHIRRGINAADSILEYIDEQEFDLVVMGTHGRTGLKKFLYGSVAEKVVRLSPIPVLTTHQKLQKFSLQKILVPIDFSDNSKKALDFAEPIAKKFDSRLTFLHVVEQEVPPAYYAATVESIFSIDKDFKDRSIEKLKELTGYEEKDADLVITEGRSHKDIVDYAEDNNFDLIIMATRGLSVLDHFLIGSTTERVVRLASCPVLTVGRK